jgi:hypothetical protein
MTNVEIITLARLVEQDLRDQDITDHAVQATLEGGRERSRLYTLAAAGSDRQFHRLVRFVQTVRRERTEMAAVLAAGAAR